MSRPREKRRLRVNDGRRVVAQAERDAMRARRIERLRRVVERKIAEVERFAAASPEERERLRAGRAASGGSPPDA